MSLFLTIANRLVLPASGLLLTTGLVWQSGANLGRLRDWISPGKAASEATGQPPVPAPAPSPRVVAEGRVVAYPGAEVVVGTEVEGRLVRLLVEEKMPVRRGELIAELNAEDLVAERAEAEARVLEAEADLHYFDRDSAATRRSWPARRVRPRISILTDAVSTRPAPDAPRRSRLASGSMPGSPRPGSWLRSTA